MRYAYGITGALLLGGAAAAMTLQPTAGAQTAQNEPGAMQQVVPRAGAPMSFADMVAKLQPAVVNISTTQHVKVPNNPFAGTPFAELFGQMNGGQGGGGTTTREAESLGSGFIISPDGYVVTNNHVISAGAQGATVDEITVTMTDGKEYKAKLVGHDDTADLAVLKIQGGPFPFVKFGDSKNARVGDWVVAIGNPFGIGSSVTAGIISALHRTTDLGGYDRFIQTDASINRGNSGGPMFDMQGQVIGINSQILSPSGGNVGIGFAIPAEEARPVVETLMKGQSVKRGYMGVAIQPITDDIASSLGIDKNTGGLIANVTPDGPAAKAGFKPGDVVMKVGNQNVTADQSLSYLVAGLQPGARVPFDVLRNGQHMTLNVTLGTRPSEQELAGFNGQDDDNDGLPDADDQTQQDQATSDSLGISTITLTPTIAQQVGVDPATKGVIITSVDSSSDAGQKLQRGLVIVSANGQPVTTPQALAAQVAAAKRAGRDQVLLYIALPKGQNRFVAVKIKK
ncbi:MAG: Do family serine endopeptidase [Sphingomonas sp.]